LSNSSRGLNFERKVRRKLERHGWTVIRAAASKGPADLIAFKAGHDNLFIECKIGGRLDTEDWNSFYDMCQELGVVPILAWQKKFPCIISMRRLTGRKTGRNGDPAPVEEYALSESDPDDE